jgi:hypothetical protein
MKKIVLAFLIIVISCSKKREHNNIEKITNRNWKEFNSKDSIPKQLKYVLQALNGNTKIADKNEVYEATDNILDTTIPTRQLRMLARKNDNWRLVYKQGGTGTYYVYIQCKIKSDALYDLKVGNTLLHIENNDSISKFINHKALILKEVKTRNR